MKKKFNEMRQKNISELKTLLIQKRKEWVKTRLDLKLKKVKNVHKSKSVRKEIARILTIMKEKELVEER